jgi:mannose-6-phosphate isomerase-like protein (cupin superfamily)
MKISTIDADHVICDTPVCFSEVRTLAPGQELDQAAGRETVMCAISGEMRVHAQRAADARARFTLRPMQGAQFPIEIPWTATAGVSGARVLRVDSPHPGFDPSRRLMAPLREVHCFDVAHGEELIYDDYVRGSILTFAPGFAADKHFHQDADEIFWFFSGTCRVITPDEDVRLPAGSIVYTPAGEWHIIANGGAEPLLMFLTVTPNIVPSHTFFRDDGTPYARSTEPLKQP